MLDQSFKKLARSIKGFVIAVGDRKVEVLEAQGYARHENEDHPYTPVLDMKSGEFFCPPHRGGLLLLIACSDGGKPGGCVLVRKVKVGDTIVNGPGRVCQALGIEVPVERGKITLRGATFVLRPTA